MSTKKNLVSISVGVVAVLFGVYPGALALADSENNLLNVGADIQTHVEADSNEGVSVGATAGATTSADVQRSDANEIDNDTHSEVSGSAVDTVNQENSDRPSKEDNSKGDNEDKNSDSEFEIDHDAALQATTTIENSDGVHNRGELHSFLNHLVKADDRVSDIHISSSTVDTNYSLPAQFLWAIPAHIPAQISVGADGSVTITYPWYAFLFARHDSELKSQLTQAASSTSASASTTLSVSEQAHFLDRIFSVLKGD